MDYNNLLAYPDFNEEFKIPTDASDFQLVAVIIHNGKPFNLYGRKLTMSQKRFTATDTEVPSIIETLKTFRTILLGQRSRIFTDPKTLHVNVLILIYC